MPKITVHGGASNAAAPNPTPAPVSAPAPVEAPTEQVGGVVDSGDAPVLVGENGPEPFVMPHGEEVTPVSTQLADAEPGEGDQGDEEPPAEDDAVPPAKSRKASKRAKSEGS